MEFLANLHPVFVHFPIVLFIIYFLFESAGIFLKKIDFNNSAYIIMITCVVFSILCVLTGNQAEEVYKLLQVPASENHHSFIEQHSQYATYSLWYFTILFFFRTYLLIKKKFNGNVLYLFVLFGLIGCILIIITGLSGGKLVYEFGIGTNILIK